MLDDLREHIESLPKPLSWHPRLALAVGRLMFVVGAFSILFGIVALGAFLFLLITGHSSLVVVVE
jgi:hypothetical protein